MNYKQEEIDGLERRCTIMQRKISLLEEELLLAIDAAAKFKIEYELSELKPKLAAAKRELEDLLTVKPSVEKSFSKKPPAKLHDHHRLTCDRQEQDTQFKGIKRAREHQVNFLYIYGFDRHEHEALVERFAYELRGVMKDYLNPNLRARCKVEQVETIYLELNDNIEAYKIEVLSQLFTVFGVDTNTCGPMLQRDLNYLWQHSARLQSLQAQDYVCCYLMIPEMDWNKEITPQVVTWFIDEFCGSTLPAEAPGFFFFLGVEFEEEDSEVKGEVKTAIRTGGSRVQILPELNSLEEKDLKQWFNRYKKRLPRRTKHTDYFKTEDIYYMDDVVVELQRLIDTINHPTS
ncbi:MAG: hypothetical protein NXI25_19255 [bacterium]|nr:hypothetical protein [bacterium]